MLLPLSSILSAHFTVDHLISKMFSPRPKTLRGSIPRIISPPPSQLALPNLPTPLTGDHPDHRFQVNHDLLYEREFERGAFVSAHLQRLQNGIFSNSNIHSDHPLYVTFVAITFTFHPVTSAGGNDHRFESAVIECMARSNGVPLKVSKFAPHLAL